MLIWKKDCGKDKQICKVFFVTINLIGYHYFDNASMVIGLNETKEYCTGIHKGLALTKKKKTGLLQLLDFSTCMVSGGLGYNGPLGGQAIFLVLKLFSEISL